LKGVDICSFVPFFTFVDQTPVGSPARFMFCVPNSAAYSRWANYPRAARPESKRAAGGRGLTESQCIQSGLGEAIELASACTWGDEPLERATMADLRDLSVDPMDIMGYSQSQIDDRLAWNQSLYGRLDWRPARVAEDVAINWIEAHEVVTGARRYLPADLVYVGRRSPGDRNAIGIANTNGCGAGRTPQGARMQALLELVERDAIGRWWFGGRNRKLLEAGWLDAHGSLLQYVVERGRVTRFFDISTDLGGHVVAAVSWQPGGRRIAMGFAAKFDLQSAVLSATIEMLQTEIGLDQRDAINDVLAERWSGDVTVEKLPFLSAAQMQPEDQPDSEIAGYDVDRCIEQLSRFGHHVYFVDLTREAFNVPVYRAVIPGLCSDKPRWGCRRLLAPDQRDIEPRISDMTSGEPPNAIPLMI